MTTRDRRPQLAIFIKPARLGRVKGRLAAGIGWVEATRFFRANVAMMLRRLGRDRRWRVSLWLDAPGSDWPRPVQTRVAPGRGWNLPRYAHHYTQGQGDLGQRMARTFARLPTRRSQERVVLIGSDIPEIEPRHIAAAFKALARLDAVLGPAADGGYWLIGMRGRARRAGTARAGIFHQVRWSSPFALADQLRNLKDFRVGLLDVLADIDTPGDYARWRRAMRSTSPT
jgi:rSAM/selenodomain-associated transferase 1